MSKITLNFREENLRKRKERSGDVIFREDENLLFLEDENHVLVSDFEE